MKNLTALIALLLTLTSCSRVAEKATEAVIQGIKKDQFSKLDRVIILEVDRKKLSGESVNREVLKKCTEVISERLSTSPYRFKLEQGGDSILVKVSSSFEKAILERAVTTDVLSFHPLVSEQSSKVYSTLMLKLDSISEAFNRANFDSTDLLDEELSELMGVNSSVTFCTPYFRRSDMDEINEKLALPEVQAFLRDVQLLWGEVGVDPGSDQEVFRLHHIEEEPAMTGEEIVKAKAMRSYSFGDYFVVSISFSNRGAKEFARTTGRCRGKQLAIVYGDRVLSAPMVNEKITGGEAQITGSFTEREAKELAAMISSGALPLPMKIR